MNIILICLLSFYYSFSQKTNYQNKISEKNDSTKKEYKIFYYDNGNISSEGYMLNGIPDGYWKNYYENGVIKSEGERKNNKLQGTWKFYNKKGILTKEINYKDNKKNGVTITYAPLTFISKNGIETKLEYDSTKYIIFKKDSFVNGIKNGKSIIYYTLKGKTNRIKKIINFKNGRENGISFEYDTTGVVKRLIVYENGFIKKIENINRLNNAGKKQGIWKEFYTDGTLKMEGYYVNGKKNGYFKEYNKKGEIIKITKYENDNEIEEAEELEVLNFKKEYYADGTLKVEGTYTKDGKKQGIFKYYDKNGKLEKSLLYKNDILIGKGYIDDKGRKQGKWEEYYKNGKISAKGKYKNGYKIGKWYYYYENGQIEQTGKYNNIGQADGEWIWYYPMDSNKEDSIQRKIMRKEFYRNGKEEGEVVEYDINGKIISKSYYVEGEKDGEWHYDIGDIKEEGEYKNDRKDGYWKEYYDNGKLFFEGEFIDGNPNGKHIYYYPNGKIMEIQNYEMGIKQGQWKKYLEDGTILLTILYENGEEKKIGSKKIRP